jgi:hypothetical protein
MLFPTVATDWNGVYIAGQLVGLRLHPNASGTIRVSVLGLPAATGFDRPCSLSSCEETRGFTSDEIQVHDTHLDCFAADPYVPCVRTGFTLKLEPGMAPVLRVWLTKLEKVSAASKSISEKFSAQLPPPIYHMFDAITSVVRRILLDGWDVGHSIAYEREHGTWGRQEEFMALFDSEDIKKDLHALAAERT